MRRGPRVADGLRKVLDGTTDLFVTIHACPFSGRYHWYQVLISPIYRGEARHAIVMHVDVSALQRNPLTRLPNTGLFDAQLDFAVSSADERHTTVGLLLIDLNNLKPINDQFGHAVGDCAIRAIAKCLTQVFDEEGMVARVGAMSLASCSQTRRTTSQSGDCRRSSRGASFSNAAPRTIEPPAYALASALPGGRRTVCRPGPSLRWPTSGCTQTSTSGASPKSSQALYLKAPGLAPAHLLGSS
jgi:hypothetical protein